MHAFDEKLAQRIDRYIESLFVPPDPILEANIMNANAAGLPPINVSAVQGKFMYLLARMAGARRILEIGTLGGYSTTWLARALPAEGRLITLEFNPTHAAAARKNIVLAGLDRIVDVREGDAGASLERMIAAGELPFDLVFIDADKPAYVKYLELSLRLARPGTVILADNVLRNGGVLEQNPSDQAAQGAKAYNEAIAAHARLESIVIPVFRDEIDGLAISIVK